MTPSNYQFVTRCRGFRHWSAPQEGSLVKAFVQMMKGHRAK